MIEVIKIYRVGNKDFRTLKEAAAFFDCSIAFMSLIFRGEKTMPAHMMEKAI